MLTSKALGNAFSLLFKVLLWSVLALTMGLVATFVVIPKIMGWVPLTVLTGSMNPDIPPGSEIVVATIDSPEDVKAVELGDIITYLPHAEDPMLITHRVIEVVHASDGSTSYITQGDNNPSPDPEPVQAKQIRGKLLYHVPYLGYLTNQLTVSDKGTGITLVAVALFLYAGWQILSAFRRKPVPDIVPDDIEALPEVVRNRVPAVNLTDPAIWILPENR